MTDGASGLLARLTQLDPALAALLTRLASLAATVLALFLVYRLVVRVVDRVTARREISTPRVRTVGVLLTNLARWLLAFVVLVVVLTELGIDVRALLVSAGLVGLAIGFGAQTLVRDLISGLFLLFEGLVSVGDVVEIGGHRGTVETIGLRVTRLRQDDGSIRVVPNGLLNDFVNLSVGFARATVDVTVGHAADLPRALATLRATAEGWAGETGAALESPEVPGIMKITGGDVVLRVSVKVDPARRFAAELELRRRIKEAFDRERVPLVATS
ncbi:MAG: mechanosensitive ion channel family protein [Candidatus Rokubacteria bacterium]|nr:mechanosensitive ion channel family protein [Candidatus Rokubacteria bacterium]